MRWRRHQRRRCHLRRLHRGASLPGRLREDTAERVERQHAPGRVHVHLRMVWHRVVLIWPRMRFRRRHQHGWLRRKTRQLLRPRL